MAGGVLVGFADVDQPSARLQLLCQLTDLDVCHGHGRGYPSGEAAGGRAAARSAAVFTLCSGRRVDVDEDRR